MNLRKTPIRRTDIQPRRTEFRSNDGFIDVRRACEKFLAEREGPRRNWLFTPMKSL